MHGLRGADCRVHGVCPGAGLFEESHPASGDLRQVHFRDGRGMAESRGRSVA